MNATEYTEDQAPLLEAWHGAYAQIWMFHIGHKRLAMRLSREDEAEDLYIIGSTCEHIHGPFSWENARLSVAFERGGAASTRVLDEGAGFRLSCNGVILVRASLKEFLTSFESFWQE